MTGVRYGDRTWCCGEEELVKRAAPTRGEVRKRTQAGREEKKRRQAAGRWFFP